MDPLLSQTVPVVARSKVIDCPLRLLCVIISAVVQVSERPTLLKLFALSITAVQLSFAASTIYYIAPELRLPGAIKIFGILSAFVAIGTILIDIITCAILIWIIVFPSGITRVYKLIKRKLSKRPWGPQYFYKVPVIAYCVTLLFISSVFVIASIVTVLAHWGASLT